jgi:hypothetical protein
MVHRNIFDIEMPKYLWQPSKPVKSAKPNMAFDSETQEGYTRLIADSNGRKIALSNLKEYLEFLSYMPYRSTVNWWYNLSYDQNSLLKFLDRDQRKEMIIRNQIDVEGFRISIIPNKELQISTLVKDEYNKDGSKKIARSIFFYDLAQFYDFKPLKILAPLVDMEKVEVEDIQNIDWMKYQVDDSYHKLINDRCVIDSEITKLLADKLTKEINKVVIVNKYKSKATIARQYVLENLKKKLDLPDYGLLQASLDCFHAGHIETMSMGSFQNVYNADINSAYPHAMSQLPSTEGIYLRNRNYEPDTIYSYYKIIIDYHNDFSSPLWYSKGSNNYHANGLFNTWVTKPEYEYLISTDFNPIIEKAYHLKETSQTIKPFENLIHDLYERRMQAKREKDPIEKVIKVILNSMYGVTINTVLKYEESEDDTDIWIVNAYNEIINYEKTFKATNMYNPLFATQITALTRMKIFNDFKKYFQHIKAISTDGIYLTKKPHSIKVTEGLGNYSLDKINKYILLGSGRYFSLDKDDNVESSHSRFRGVSLPPSQMYGAMDINRDKKNIEVNKTKVIKLKEAHKNSKYYNLTFASFPLQQFNQTDLFNTFQITQKKINFYEQRRKWYGEFETIQDIFDTQLISRPYNTSELI